MRVVSIFPPTSIIYFLLLALSEQKAAAFIRVSLLAVLSDSVEMRFIFPIKGASMFIPEALAQILVCAVGKDRDDDAGFEFSRYFERGSQRRARRDTNQQAFFPAEPTREIVRRFGADFKIDIGYRRIIDARYNRRLHMLQAFK